MSASRAMRVGCRALGGGLQPPPSPPIRTGHSVLCAQSRQAVGQAVTGRGLVPTSRKPPDSDGPCPTPGTSHNGRKWGMRLNGVRPTETGRRWGERAEMRSVQRVILNAPFSAHFPPVFPRFPCSFSFCGNVGILFKVQIGKAQGNGAVGDRHSPFHQVHLVLVSAGHPTALAHRNPTPVAVCVVRCPASCRMVLTRDTGRGSASAGRLRTEGACSGVNPPNPKVTTWPSVLLCPVTARP